MNTLPLCFVFAVGLLLCGPCQSAPANPDPYTLAAGHDQAARQYDRQRRLPEAAAEYAQVIRLQPHWSEGYLGLAWDLRDEGRPQDAERVLRDAVRVNPKSAECYYGIGDMLLEQHRSTDSIAVFLRSVQLNPRLWSGYYQLGGAYGEAGLWRNALIVNLAWVRRQPDAADAHDGLAYDYEKCGSSLQAAAQYKLALKLDPNDPLAGDNLGCLLAKQGQRAEAHRLWQWVLDHPNAGHVHPDGTRHDDGIVADVRQMFVQYP